LDEIALKGSRVTERPEKPQTPDMRLSIFSVQDHYPTRSRTLPQLYDQIIAQAELAERLGYDTFFVAEHHFHEYGAVPNPAVMLSTLAQRTKRLRLGSAISILTFHNPLTVAESYAMADVLSGGRIVLGVGSGYLQHEFAGYQINPTEKRDRFDENLAILNRVGAYHVGRQGNAIMCVPYASVDHFDEIGPMVAEFRKGRAEAGFGPSDDDGTFAFHTHVADSDAACRHEAAAAFDLYVETRLYAKKRVYDDILRSDLALFGSVDAVAAKMLRLYDMGIRHVLTLQNFGLMPPELVHNSMRLMATEVMPRVRAALAKRRAA
jgi:alkanesulfonate monooxygenase SsuD/methylene tetrahydromethanopterin reductase-like flavin-dependent oxidoreductase (luciferase family)